MKRALVLAVFFGGPAVARGQESEPRAADPRKLVMQASVLRNPGSVCNLPTPRSAFRTAYRGGASTTMQGCLDLDTLKATPVLLAVRSTDSTGIVAYRLPLLSEVTVRSAKGERAAMAVWHNSGQGNGFLTKLEGVIEAQLRPGDTVWFLYLVPALSPGSRLQVKGYAPIELRM